MVGEDASKTRRRAGRGAFVARELQLSIAVLAVMALLGGALLQTFSRVIVDYMGFGIAAHGFLLIVGYAVLVVILSVFFTHRLVGPFKRIEHEMKFVTTGELTRRLTVRNSDDLHVKRFVGNVNNFISGFEEMSKEYSKLNSTATIKLDGIIAKLSREDLDCELIKDEINDLRKEIHALREKW